MSSFARTVRKRRSSKHRFADADEGLPDIAEAEAVLLDLARVFADPATSPANVSGPFHLKVGKERMRMRKRRILRPNIAHSWSKYRRSSSWLISTEVSAKHM